MPIIIDENLQECQILSLEDEDSSKENELGCYKCLGIQDKDFICCSSYPKCKNWLCSTCYIVGNNNKTLSFTWDQIYTSGSWLCEVCDKDSLFHFLSKSTKKCLVGTKSAALLTSKPKTKKSSVPPLPTSKSIEKKLKKFTEKLKSAKVCVMFYTSKKSIVS